MKSTQEEKEATKLFAQKKKKKLIFLRTRRGQSLPYALSSSHEISQPGELHSLVYLVGGESEV